VRDQQIERLNQVKARRDNGAVALCLDKLKMAAKRDENLMPITIEAVKAYATVEEICSALRDVYGVYEEPVI
jgi:methylmalonyl-CoA mutase N-terminal domain/subunit